MQDRKPVVNRVAIVVLAAGSSTRMGTSKQLLEIAGTNLLTHVVEEALHSSAMQTMVVLGANADAHRSAISHLNAKVVVNEAWQAGIGSSIKCGIQSLLNQSENLDAIVLSVCDQPLLSRQIFNHLISVYLKRPAPAVASGYAGTIGVPALFDKILFARLNKLEDHEGAKKLLGEMGDIQSVVFEGGELDLDTPKDYETFNGVYLNAKGFAKTK